MTVIFFCGDPHSRFTRIIRAVQQHRPEAVVLLGDITPNRPLELELADILDMTKIFCICGNHDTDNAEHHDNLFESKLKGCNIQERGVVKIAGLLVGGIDGVLRERYGTIAAVLMQRACKVRKT